MCMELLLCMYVRVCACLCVFICACLADRNRVSELGERVDVVVVVVVNIGGDDSAAAADAAGGTDLCALRLKEVSHRVPKV